MKARLLYTQSKNINAEWTLKINKIRKVKIESDPESFLLPSFIGIISAHFRKVVTRNCDIIIV